MRFQFLVSNWLVLVFVGIIVLEKTNADENAIGVADIVAAWEQTSHQYEPLQIEWRHTKRQGADEISLYQATWAFRSEAERTASDNFVYKLTAQGNRFRYSSQRWAVGPHRLDVVTNDLIIRKSLQYDSYIQKYGETGLDFEFSSNLYNRFRDPSVGFRDPQPFNRASDGFNMVDVWQVTRANHARVTVRKPPVLGSVAWARLTPEVEWSDQIDSLNLQAALLSVGKTSSLGIEIHEARLSIRDERHTIHGHECLVIDEFGDNTRKNFRTFWVDPKANYRIRRFMSTVAISHSQSDAQRVGAMPGRFAKTQIDIRYKPRADTGIDPTSWTVIACAPHSFPLFAFARSEVSNISSPLPEQTKESNFESDIEPIGAWVINEPLGTQYIVRKKNDVRFIQEQELELKPMYEDLLNTEPGEIENREWENPTISKLRRLLAVVGTILIGYAGLTHILRSRL